MLNAIQSRASLVLLTALAVPACGGGESPSGPTPQYARGTETHSGPPLAAHSSFCKDFNNARAGAVSADVTPPSIRLTLAVGTCGVPGQILAERDGEVTNVDAPAGANHVTVSNRSDLDTPYTLRITHWY